ncbi:MAG: helicase HerA-like domain-containing protein [Gaiellaceae bacterium]
MAADGFRLGTTGDGEPLILEPRDLTTHGVIVGMTGSGKTGLGIVLLEEALSAGVPVLALDPKGDLGNLLLTFPDLAPASFQPWVNESDAREAGLSVEDYAAKVAADWKEGLAASGIGPERIQALRDTAELTVYTPGSSAGIPLNLIGSLKAPPLSWETETETLRDEIEGTVSSLLGLVGLAADPLSSREHVLLSNLVEHAWRAGRDLDLGTLIAEIQSPPLRKLGVFEIDSFFPPKERTELALKLNALVASPSFAIWAEGAALDIAEMLGGAPGKPRAAIVYLAHLSDEERQFAVTLILSKVVTWMRGLSGTSDLRALVYMDEVFGFVPPTAAPPAKKPILTILKQARAYGVGMVLATQNPVDLDYKAMSNAATWLVGRLQTERDKQRVLEGLKSAAGDADVDSLDESIGGLQKRQFLLVSAHEPKPVVFSTRWAMSYLRGPLTKEQIELLMQGRERPAAVAAAARPDLATESPPPASANAALYVHPAAPWLAQVGGAPTGARLRPFLAARLSLRFDDAASDVDASQEWEALYGPLESGLDLDSEVAVDYDDRDFVPTPPAGATYADAPTTIGEDAFLRDARVAIQRRVADAQTLTVFRNSALKLYSRPGESREAFAIRADEAAQTEADREAATIRDRLEAKRERLETALETARRRAEELETDQKTRTATELLAGAGTVLSVLLGGRGRARTIARAGSAIGTAASRRGMTARAGERRRTAEEKAAATEQTLAELEQELLDEVAEIDAEWAAKADELDEIEIRLESSDVRVLELDLVWVPTA